MLRIDSLSVAVDGTPIISDISLSLEPGSLAAIMGPNGSGKSSLALTLAGHPRYRVTAGQISLDNEEISSLSPDRRARMGLFLSLQQPIELPGVSVFSFLREGYHALNGPIEIKEFQAKLFEAMDVVGLAHEQAQRAMHEGFSGGEKKRLELLQLLLFKPRVAILDELDSGCDLQMLQIIAQVITQLRALNTQMSLLVISHNPIFISSLNPDRVHLMHKGKLAHSGNASLITTIAAKGYDAGL